tara:strand:+ start:3184 stop:3318 length:135 start_codon:yes stop_codon:yes gene_type:complete
MYVRRFWRKEQRLIDKSAKHATVGFLAANRLFSDGFLIALFNAT